MYCGEELKCYIRGKELEDKEGDGMLLYACSSSTWELAWLLWHSRRKKKKDNTRWKIKSTVHYLTIFFLEKANNLIRDHEQFIESYSYKNFFKILSWRCSSVIQHLPSMHEGLRLSSCAKGKECKTRSIFLWLKFSWNHHLCISKLFTHNVEIFLS